MLEQAFNFAKYEVETWMPAFKFPFKLDKKNCSTISIYRAVLKKKAYFEIKRSQQNRLKVIRRKPHYDWTFRNRRRSVQNAVTVCVFWCQFTVAEGKQPFSIIRRLKMHIIKLFHIVCILLGWKAMSCDYEKWCIRFIRWFALVKGHQYRSHHRLTFPIYFSIKPFPIFRNKKIEIRPLF